MERHFTMILFLLSLLSLLSYLKVSPKLLMLGSPLFRLKLIHMSLRFFWMENLNTTMGFRCSLTPFMICIHYNFVLEFLLVNGRTTFSHYLVVYVQSCVKFSAI